MAGQLGYCGLDRGRQPLTGEEIRGCWEGWTLATGTSVPLTIAAARPGDEARPPLEFVECATQPAALGHLDTGTIDLAILDGEAVPAGGLGIARQLKDEIFRCPPVLVLIGRPQDAWLATWSRADGVVSYPLDPIDVASAVADLMRRRLAAAQSA